MKIKLNGEERVFDKELSLNELVQAELNSDEPKGVAVALNYKIIPLFHADFQKHLLFH